MSHTMVFGYGIQVTGNSDWSGMMTVSWKDKTVEVPGYVLRTIIEHEGRKIVRREVLKAFGLEDGDGE